MKELILSIGFSQFLIKRLLNLSIIFLLGVLAISLNACALTTHGTVQRIPVNSNPEGARVFVNGEPTGVTPLELKLARNKTHTLKLIYNGQEQIVVVKSSSDTTSILLDTVPAAVSGGLTIAACLSIDSEEQGLAAVGFGTFCLGGVLVTLLAGTPIYVDAATGAWHKLSPKEVMVDFDQ